MADRDLTEDDVWGDDGGGADREEGEEVGGVKENEAAIESFER